MQLRMSPGARMSKVRRSLPELPPSSLTVTTAARSTRGPSPPGSAQPAAKRLSPWSTVDRPVPPPSATMRRGSWSVSILGWNDRSWLRARDAPSRFLLEKESGVLRLLGGFPTRAVAMKKLCDGGFVQDRGKIGVIQGQNSAARVEVDGLF